METGLYSVLFSGSKIETRPISNFICLNITDIIDIIFVVIENINENLYSP